MATAKENAERIVRNLVDTSMSLEDAFQITGIEETQEILDMVFNEVFLCQKCYYWFVKGDASADEDICITCA